MQRRIIHTDLDSFFVSVERLRNSKLNGKPVIIGGLSDRGVVASCSYEARQYGVHSAMPTKIARMLCKDAVFIRGDIELYSRYSNIVTEIIAERAPLYEKASIDEHYIDVTGMDTFFNSAKWAHELRQTIIKETGLPVSLGLSENKTVSKIAAGEAKPNGEKEVPHELIKPFLYPLSINKMPMIGEKTSQLLRSMGISTIGVLSEIPVEMIEKTLGKNGIMIWKRANGIDDTPVIPYWEEQSISSERTFETDTADMQKLYSALSRMVENICYELRKKQKLASCITVKIRYSNFDTHTLQKRISYTSFDHIILDTARILFDRLYTRRMLIRLVGIKLSHLVHGFQQLNMFDDTSEIAKLYKAIDSIRNKFGQKSVRIASGF